MENKISKILDDILSRVAFDLSKRDIRISYKDHIALEILQEQSSMAYHLLASTLKDTEIEHLPAHIESLINTQPLSESSLAEEFLHGFRKQLQVDYALSHRISTAHALSDIVADTSTITSQILAQYGVNAHTITSLLREVTSTAEGGYSPIQYPLWDMDNEMGKSTQNGSLLDKYGTDLTRLAREGQIDPVIGREGEINRVVQILARRKKNNPILIGEAGVGKSAIVEALALRIITNDVPPPIRGKSLYSLDVASLVAGTKFRGEFEERMQQLLEELRHNDNSIIFIDEIHTIAGAGSTQGSLDTANILKPALARGEVQTIGATTLDEYRENIECDSALERRFQKVIIEPTTAEQTLTILRSIASRYEQFHNVRYTDDALQACVELTERYITHRNFPDKAIDVMDEAGAYCKLNNSAKEGTKTEPFYSWLTAIDTEHTIERSHIEQVITAMTDIPIERITQNEVERLRNIESHLQSRVIGQTTAVSRIANALRRSRVGLRNPEQPIGVFLLVGPTGTGKTLLAKELSKFLFGDRQGLIRIDMTEYGERHNISRLIGSPPGYVGYGEGGQLTEAIRRQPYAVVLFDEVEKAHPEVFNVMLQIFDEGHLTDGSGRRVDFRNTIIILTSNVGSRSAHNLSAPIGYNAKVQQTDRNISEEYRKAIERVFAPELLNRVDEIICFSALTVEDIMQIIEIELGNILTRCRKQGYMVEISPKAKQYLATMGYQSRYGARALKRTLTNQIEEPLASLIVDGKVAAGGLIKIDNEEDEGITLRVA